MGKNRKLLGLHGITWLTMGGQGQYAQNLVNNVENQLTIISILQ